MFQVDLEKMQEAVVNVDETLQKLTNEEIDGQLAVVQVGGAVLSIYFSLVINIFPQNDLTLYKKQIFCSTH